MINEKMYALGANRSCIRDVRQISYMIRKYSVTLERYIRWQLPHTVSARRHM